MAAPAKRSHCSLPAVRGSSPRATTPNLGRGVAPVSRAPAPSQAPRHAHAPAMGQSLKPMTAISIGASLKLTTVLGSFLPHSSSI